MDKNGIKIRRKVERVILWVFMIFLALLAASPLIFLAAGAFMGNGEIQTYIGPVLGVGEGFARWRLLPAFPTMKNVIELLLDSPEFFQMFWNTMKITVGILSGQLLFGVPAAWGLAQYDFPGKKLIYGGYIIFMMLPFQVTMLSEYLVLDGMGLLDTMRAVILPGMFSTFPAFLMYRFFCGVPKELIEAARIDGAGEGQIFFRVGLPVGSSGILAAMILEFLDCQSMLEEPLAFLETKALFPLSLYLPDINLKQAGFAVCASLFALLPALLVFLCGQEYLEEGIVASAIKE